jgi:hypothetical protein
MAFPFYKRALILKSEVPPICLTKLKSCLHFWVLTNFIPVYLSLLPPSLSPAIHYLLEGSSFNQTEEIHGGERYVFPSSDVRLISKMRIKRAWILVFLELRDEGLCHLVQKFVFHFFLLISAMGTLILFQDLIH